VITPLPGATPTKAGSATLPFFGVEPAVIDATSGVRLNSTAATGVLCFARPWPGMVRP